MKSNERINRKLKIKKGDTVEVIAGADKGKKAVVSRIDSQKLEIVVQGVKMMTHFDKEKGQFQKEAPIDYSNVKLVEKTSSAKKKSSKKASIEA